MATEPEEKPAAAVPAATAAEKTNSFGLTVRRAANLDEADWTNERIQAIRETVAPPGTTLAQLAIFLATAQEYGLNPMLREIWLADMRKRGQDGQASGPPKYSVVTGRDAFVKVMNKQADFQGLIAATIYAKDKFGIRREGDRVIVTHDIDGIDRGLVVGAYAVIQRKGKPDQFVIRKASQFQHLMGKDSWKFYPDDMMVTRCVVIVGRLAYNLAGLEEQSVAEDIASGADPMLVAPGAAVEGTKSTADALRERITKRAGGKPADEVPEAAFEVLGEDPKPAEGVQAPETTEEEIRRQELAILKDEDPEAYARAMKADAKAKRTREPGEEDDADD